jgi:probable rRNA maturation factor
MYDYPEDEGELFPGDEALSLGDIVISVERAKKQAEEIGNSFEREVAFLAIHSTLHLLGYDHERSAEDDEIQCKRQKEIIEKLYK